MVESKIQEKGNSFAAGTPPLSRMLLSSRLTPVTKGTARLLSNKPSIEYHFSSWSVTETGKSSTCSNRDRHVFRKIERTALFILTHCPVDQIKCNKCYAGVYLGLKQLQAITTAYGDAAL